MSDHFKSGIARLMAEAAAKKAGTGTGTGKAPAGLPAPASTPTPEPPPIESNPFLVRNNDQLLAPVTESVADDSVTEKQLPLDATLHSSEQLARINTDTDEFEPKDSHEKTELVKAAEMAKDLVLKDSSSVRNLCDKIDELIESHDQLVGPSLITLRGYVQTLMVTLKTRPEFDEIIIDKDVRNVMKFIRSVRETALATREVKITKKAVRETKAAKNAPTQAAFAAAFKSVMQAQIKP